MHVPQPACRCEGEASARGHQHRQDRPREGPFRPLPHVAAAGGLWSWERQTGSVAGLQHDGILSVPKQKNLDCIKEHAS